MKFSIKLFLTIFLITGTTAKSLFGMKQVRFAVVMVQGQGQNPMANPDLLVTQRSEATAVVVPELEILKLHIREAHKVLTYLKEPRTMPIKSIAASRTISMDCSNPDRFVESLITELDALCKSSTVVYIKLTDGLLKVLELSRSIIGHLEDPEINHRGLLSNLDELEGKIKARNAEILETLEH